MGLLVNRHLPAYTAKKVLLDAEPYQPLCKVSKYARRELISGQGKICVPQLSLTPQQEKSV
jgi:hypothetical protein